MFQHSKDVRTLVRGDGLVRAAGFNMTSILTNTAAMAALQTLRTIGSNLDKTQEQVSSGLRIKTAADNAAYWSISTTMRSDNMAISAVADALGLGAAKIDTSYAGLDATVDILSEFRAKLVAAKEPGVDKTKIQKELDQFKEQLKSVAASASFNGVNWLQTDDPRQLFEISSLPAEIVSSFIRSSDGSVRVGTTKLELADVSLFNAGGGGALQADPRSLGDIGGFRTATLNDSGRQGSQTRNLTGLPITLTGSDTISLTVDIDGSASQTLTIDKSLIDSTLGVSTGAISNASDYAAVLTQAFVNAGIDNKVTVSSTAGSLYFRSLETTGSTQATVAIEKITGTPSAIPTGFVVPTTQTWQTANLPLLLDAGDNINFRVDVDGTTYFLTIDDTLVNSALGITTGAIASTSAYATVLTQAFTDAGINTKISVASSGSNLTFQTLGATSDATVGIKGITRNSEDPTGFVGTGTSTAGTTSIGDYAKTQFAFTSPFRVYRDVAFQFELTVDNTVQQVSVDRNLVDSVLGTSDGMINTAAEFAQVLNAAMSSLGVKVTDKTGTITLDIDTALHPNRGTRSVIAVNKLGDNIGIVADFNIVDVDITNSANSLDNYLNGLDAMLRRVTNAGSTLGAVKTRIDMQTDFAHTLMDTLDKGIGRLVDADMNEASTRLKALQTQQQLAIQALQIANSNAENVMQLFRQ